MWHIYWICGVYRAAKVLTEGTILIYMVLLVQTRCTVQALQDAHSIAPIHAHSNTPPHFAHSLRPAAKCFTLADGKALVSELTTMSSVRQEIRCREPCSMTHQMKC